MKYFTGDQSKKLHIIVFAWSVRQQNVVLPRLTLEQQKEILVNAGKKVSACLSKRSKNSKQALFLLEKANNGLQMELSHSMACWTSQLDKAQSKLEVANFKLAALQKKASHLWKSVACASGVKDRAVAAAKAKVKEEMSTHHLMNKGIYTEET